MTYLLLCSRCGWVAAAGSAPNAPAASTPMKAIPKLFRHHIRMRGRRASVTVPFAFLRCRCLQRKRHAPSVPSRQGLTRKRHASYIRTLLLATSILSLEAQMMRR
ncbi:hypothetical protein BDW02DRAFT_349292 [Decorospora gaudefroyi]|uniref:Secreted protein n=1 Tax=Decorospora gaudefroyi TaxID=184978 RepID=A0A6A5KFW9_9PLEO|nr:hypothetical protein BDW02DRAFT_349292 [Decorospora gaudefroyi]